MTGNVVIAAGLLIGGAGYLAMAAYVWRRRRATGAHALFVALMAIFVWTVGYAIETTTRTEQAAAFWLTVRFVGILTLTPALLAFAVEYTGLGRYLTRRNLALLAVEPLIVIGLLTVPGARDLFLPYDPATMTETTDWPLAETTGLFYAHTAYSYVVLVCTLVLLVWRLARLARSYRRAAVTMIIASITPWVGNALYVTEVVHVDPTPFLLSVVAAVLVWGFFRMGLLDLVPIARSAVLDQMSDAVLVLDAYNRVIDANPAATELLAVSHSQLIGRDIGVVMPALAGMVQAHRPGSSRDDHISTPAAPLAPRGPSAVHIAAQLSSLTDGTGHEAGRLLVLRDETQRIETEHRLRHLLESESRVAAVLQTSLRPASLPSVPRVHLAARSVPSGHGAQVSGDFYDVHQALGGEWAFVLGDVAGKGVHAAVVTSMARYTVRTLSAQGWGPQKVIEQLNQAVLIEAEPELFCTVVYGRFSQIDTPPEVRAPCGVRLTLALGGHPLPLVRRVDGRIEAIGIPGTAIGILPVIDIEEVSVELASGEVMVAYTDGVTEARRDGVEFGEERLARALSLAAQGLRGHTGQAAAALLADAVADQVIAAVTEYAHDRDDIAVLVMAIA